jgi:hypothetical protein
MTVSGEGTVKIRDGAESMKIDFNSDSKLIRGFLRYGGQATFEGESSFDVYDIATYGELYGRDVDSIPDGGDEIRIDLREKLGDFLAFASVAETADGTAIKNAVLRDGVITLPVTFSGEVLLTYRRMPKMPNLSYPDAAIDIPREYESLLPLLTAFYILLDDDAEKAEIYERAYRETLASLKINGYAVSNNGYADVSGWGK